MVAAVRSNGRHNCKENQRGAILPGTSGAGSHVPFARELGFKPQARWTAQRGRKMQTVSSVVPADGCRLRADGWIPACAGMTAVRSRVRALRAEFEHALRVIALGVGVQLFE